jgi:hypothetical protein
MRRLILIDGLFMCPPILVDTPQASLVGASVPVVMIGRS